MSISRIYDDPEIRAALRGVYPILNVYPETDVHALLDWATRLPEAGIKMVQLRVKRIDDAAVPEILDDITGNLKGAGMRVILNDYVELVRITGADGLHLGLDDFPIVEARAMLGPRSIIGATCRHHAEALMAVGQGATYVAAGSIYPSSTKTSAPVIGLAGLRDVIEHIDLEAPKRDGWGRRNNVPVCAIGGINKDNVREVYDAGASMVAVVDAIQNAKHPVKAARELMVAWDRAETGAATG